MASAVLTSLTTPQTSPAPAAPKPVAPPPAGPNSFAQALNRVQQPAEGRADAQPAATPDAPKDEAPTRTATPPKAAPKPAAKTDPAKTDKKTAADDTDATAAKASDADATDKPEKADKASDTPPAATDPAALPSGWQPPNLAAEARTAARGSAAQDTGAKADSNALAATDGREAGNARNSSAAQRGKGLAAADATTDTAGAAGERGGFAAALAEAAQGQASGHGGQPSSSDGDARDNAPGSPLGAGWAAATGAAPATTGAAAAPAAAAPPAFEAQLSAALGSPEFAPALGVQLSVLAREGVQEARLHLNPADMGPIHVQIAVDGSQAQVSFQADVAATRQALENSMPDLAAAFGQAGLTLSGGDVSQQSARDPNSGTGDSRSGGGTRSRIAGDDVGPARTTAVPRQVAPRGAVDLYA
jgi:flagellar hook-length control protein FliK